jgi:hypothetical protein
MKAKILRTDGPKERDTLCMGFPIPLLVLSA